MKISRRAWLLVILLFGFALRFFRLGVASLWYDETVSAFLARQDLVSLTRHTAGDIHPPLYYYLLHFWGQFAGGSEFSLAFLSLFFGIVLIALVYRVAREWFSPGVGTIAALFTALSPYNLWYSQEVRMYTLGAALGLVSVYLFVRLLRRQTTDNSRQIFFSRDFIAYVLISVAGIYTLYYFAFLLVFENLVAIVWLFSKTLHSPRGINSEIINHKSEISIWLFSQLTVLLLFLPWLPIALRQAIDPPVPPWRSFTALPQVLLESFSALALGQSIEPVLALPALILVVTVILLAMRRDKPTARIGGWFLLGYTFVPLAIIFLLSLWKPLYHIRYLFIYAPAFYILLALGFSRVTHHLARPKFSVLLLAFYFAFCAFSVYNFWFSPQYAKDDLRGAVQYLAEHYRPGDAILINAGYTYTAFDYYFDQPMAWRGRLTDYMPQNSREAMVLQTGSIGGSATLGWGNPESDFYPTTVDATRVALDRVFATHARVWMLRLYDTVVDPDGVVRDYLAQRGKIIDDQGFAGEAFVRVQGYLTTRQSSTQLPANLVRRNVILGDRIALLGFEPAAMAARAGETIDVNLFWQAQSPTNVDQHLFVGLFAQDDTLAAASDEMPIGNAWGTSRWTPGEIWREPVRLKIPARAASGAYTLRVALYDPHTNEPLAARGEGAMENGQVQIAVIQIN